MASRRQLCDLPLPQIVPFAIKQQEIFDKQYYNCLFVLLFIYLYNDNFNHHTVAETLSWTIAWRQTIEMQLFTTLNPCNGQCTNEFVHTHTHEGMNMHLNCNRAEKTSCMAETLTKVVYSCEKNLYIRDVRRFHYCFSRVLFVRIEMRHFAELSESLRIRCFNEKKFTFDLTF